MSYWCVIVLVSALVALLGTGTDYKIGATSDKITSADPYSKYNWSKGRVNACKAIGGTCTYGELKALDQEEESDLLRPTPL